MIVFTLALFYGLCGPYGSQDRPQVELELLWEAGSVDGGSGTDWMQLWDAILKDGFVFALDIRLPAFRRFRLDGSFDGEIGRLGQGPGEFVSPTMVAANPQSVEVFERSPSRRTTFGLDGEVIETVAVIVPEGHVALSWARLLQHGWTVASTVGELVEGHTDFQTSILAWRDPREVDTLAQYLGWTLSGIVNENPLPIPIPPSAGPTGDAAILGDSIIALLDGDAGTLQLLRSTPEGIRTIRRWDLPTKATQLTESDRENMLEISHDRWPGVVLSEIAYPEKRSGWVKIEVESQEALWLKRGAPFVSAKSGVKEEWVRWNIESGISTQLTLPAGVTALGFAPGFLIAKRLGEWDVEYLQLYRLVVS